VTEQIVHALFKPTGGRAVKQSFLAPLAFFSSLPTLATRPTRSYEFVKKSQDPGMYVMNAAVVVEEADEAGSAAGDG